MIEKDCNRAISEETDVKLILIICQWCSELLFTYIPGAEFLDEIQTIALRVFLLAIHSHLYNRVQRKWRTQTLWRMQNWILRHITKYFFLIFEPFFAWLDSKFENCEKSKEFEWRHCIENICYFQRWKLWCAHKYFLKKLIITIDKQYGPLFHHPRVGADQTLNSLYPTLQLCLENYISSNSRNLLQFLEFSYFTL